jgi:hypothetical protein
MVCNSTHARQVWAVQESSLCSRHDGGVALLHPAIEPREPELGERESNKDGEGPSTRSFEGDRCQLQ